MKILVQVGIVGFVVGFFFQFYEIKIYVHLPGATAKSSNHFKILEIGFNIFFVYVFRKPRGFYYE